MRTFCLTLHYYSPRAYNYVRSKFDCNLPSVTAMRNWYASMNASPGFTSESFNILREKAAKEMKEKGTKLPVCFMYDEMSIHKQSQFNPSTLKFDGFVDVGRPTNEQTLPLARDALVFMVSGIEETFQNSDSIFFYEWTECRRKSSTHA